MWIYWKWNFTYTGLPQNFEKIETIREMSKKSASDNNEFRWDIYLLFDDLCVINVESYILYNSRKEVGTDEGKKSINSEKLFFYYYFLLYTHKEGEKKEQNRTLARFSYCEWINIFFSMNDCITASETRVCSVKGLFVYAIWESFTSAKYTKRDAGWGTIPSCDISIKEV